MLVHVLFTHLLLHNIGVRIVPICLPVHSHMYRDQMDSLFLAQVLMLLFNFHFLLFLITQRYLYVQGFIIIRDENDITSRILEVAPKFLWEVESQMLENKEKKMETVLICRKKFWAIV